jgi:polar amino acid transport system permease protein
MDSPEPKVDRRRREALAMASASVPFKFKQAAVWVAMFALVAVLFALSGFDTAWMTENAAFIAGGLRVTVIIAVAAIALAITLALLGALGRLSSNPVAFAVSGFYTSFFRGTPLIVQMFLIYLALPQIGRDAPPWLRDLLILDAVPAGILALYDRDLPRRDPVGEWRPVRSRRSSRDELLSEAPKSRSSTGRSGNNSSDRQ